MFERLKLLLKYTIIYFLVVSSWTGNSQGDFFLKRDASEKINFELVGNLIVMPLEINGVALNFILDSGVSKPILFNLSDRDSLDLKNTETFFLHGLGGDGELEAMKSSFNRLKIGDAIAVNKDIFVVFDETINFTSQLGMVVNGIIGYDIFKDFVVEINYRSKYVRLHKPNRFKPKTSSKWTTIPIKIHKKKPYLDAKVTITDIENPVKLLIDTGSSDALWIFEDKKNSITPDEDLVFIDYLGHGLSGSVYGKRSKTKQFLLSNFKLNNVNVAFPDSASIDITKVYKGRNGSLGGEILKRFNLFLDYPSGKLHIKKNAYFNAPFNYNNSGIVVQYNGTMFVREEIKVPIRPNGNSSTNRSKNAVQIDYYLNYIMRIKPAYEIVEVRKSSNAYAVGIRPDDILMSINGKRAYNYKLSEINEILHGKTGKTTRLQVEREGETLSFKFKLDNVFKKKSPQTESSKLLDLR